MIQSIDIDFRQGKVVGHPKSDGRISGKRVDVEECGPALELAGQGKWAKQVDEVIEHDVGIPSHDFQQGTGVPHGDGLESAAGDVFG